MASSCGTLAHTGLMELKSRSGLLPDFDPSASLRTALSSLVAGAIPQEALVWLLSPLNGAALIGLLFGRFFNVLPGSNGLTKGLILGCAGWLLLATVLFPALGIGIFAFSLNLGFGPALFSFAMVQSYSLVLGFVYAVLQK